MDDSFTESKIICFLSSWLDQELPLTLKYLESSSLSSNISIVYINLTDSLSVDLEKLLEKVEIIHEKEKSLQLLLKFQISSLPFVIDNNMNQVSDHIEHLKSLYGIQSASLRDQCEECFSLAIESFNSFNLNLAAQYFHKVLIADPHHKDALFNMASILHIANFPMLSINYIEQLLQSHPLDMISHNFLWALARTENCQQLAIKAYERLSSIGDINASHKLATLTGIGSTVILGNPNYARQLYNDMGDKFESRLVDVLDYRGPWILKEMIIEALATLTHTDNQYHNNIEEKEVVVVGDGESNNNNDHDNNNNINNQNDRYKWKILDLGCGSGLCGKVFSDFLFASSSLSSLSELKTKLPLKPEEKSSKSVENNTDNILPYSNVASVSELINPIDSNISSINDTLLTNNNDNKVIQAVITGDDDDDERLLEKALLELEYGMIGIDVSERMVEITQQSGYYMNVFRCDVLQSLNVCWKVIEQDSSKKLHLILAADTFIYIGALAKIFDLVRRILLPSNGSGNSGFFAFTTEALEAAVAASPCSENDTSGGDAQAHVGDDDITVKLVDGEIEGAIPGWGARLLSSARFAHSERYIGSLCDLFGFRMVSKRNIVLRKEESFPLAGYAFLLALK